MIRFVFYLVIISTCIAFSTPAMTIDSMSYGRFGKIYVYKNSPAPQTLLILISGDGQWNKEMKTMAKVIAKENAVVAGINIKLYYANLSKSKSQCVYPAGDFENLSIFIQKKLKFKAYDKPTLVGYSSGATLVYALLTQAPKGTFKGGISLGFCPDLEFKKMLCNGSGLKTHVIKKEYSWYIEPVNSVKVPWYILQGQTDKVCKCDTVFKFTWNMKNAKAIQLSNVGHGFKKAESWSPQMHEAFEQIQALAKEESRFNTPSDISIKHIPVVITSAVNDDEKPMCIMISGDGGWTDFDQSIATGLSNNRIPSVGLDAQKYFWEAKTPEQITKDIQLLISFYMKLWNKKRIILVGYSFGADIFPFVINRLSANNQLITSAAFLLSPDLKADFEIHYTDMLGIGNFNDDYDVAKEINAIKNIKTICLFGKDEESEVLPLLTNTIVQTKILPGTHHYNNDYTSIVSIILNAINGK